MQEHPPPCPHGHEFQPGRVLVGWRHCSEGGHRSYWCRDHGVLVLAPVCLVKRQAPGLLGFRR